MNKSVISISKYLIIIALALIGHLPVIAQTNLTFIDSTTVCPNSLVYIPVRVTNVQNVDSISLILNYPAETMDYIEFRQVNPLLKTGFYSVTETTEGLIFSWASDAPVSISNDKLLELVFMSGNLPGDLEWDEINSLYNQTGGEPVAQFYRNAYMDMFPEFFVELDEIDATCAGQCNANIAAYVTGGLPPFQYLWNAEPALFDSIKTGACSGINNLKVTDANDCIVDTNFIVSQLASTNVEVDVNPDTVYMQNPVVHFSFTEDQSITEWLWDFGDGTEKSRERNPVHVYSTAATPELENYKVVLQVVNDQGCDTLILFTLPVSEVELFIPNVFTPNGDNTNDVFKIAKANDGGSASGSNYIPINLEYIRMELVVLDRWGRRVYSNENYKNNWDGGNLPDGTYFYKLDTYGYFKNESYKGAVTILGGGRN